MLDALDSSSGGAQTSMGNVNMPTPVALAAGGLCLLGGYLVGVVAGPDTTARTTAEVTSYERETETLCLGGGAVKDLPEARDGELCGTWRHKQGAPVPRAGDTFRFVTMSSEGTGSEETAVYIYGDVVR
jgi:hypothetical protein